MRARQSLTFGVTGSSDRGRRSRCSICWTHRGLPHRRAARSDVALWRGEFLRNAPDIKRLQRSCGPCGHVFKSVKGQRWIPTGAPVPRCSPEIEPRPRLRVVELNRTSVSVGAHMRFRRRATSGRAAPLKISLDCQLADLLIKLRKLRLIHRACAGRPPLAAANRAAASSSSVFFHAWIWLA